MRIALEVGPALRGPWGRLPAAARWYLGAFFAGGGPIEPYWDPDFAGWLSPQGVRVNRDDLDDLAHRLSTAFPRLERRLLQLDFDGGLTAHLECEGAHEGAWHGILGPTGRRVRFEERHVLVVASGRLRSASITLDLASIITQLCGTPSEGSPDGSGERPVSTGAALGQTADPGAGEDTSVGAGFQARLVVGG